MTNLYRALSELEEENKPGVLCTVIKSEGSTPRNVGSKMLVYSDGNIVGTIGGGEMESRVITEALKAVKNGEPRILSYSMVDPKRGDPGVCGGQVEVFLDPVMPSPVLVVVGGGHVGKAVAHLASWLGFHIVVTDDRPEYASLEAVPDGDEFYPLPLQDLISQIDITPWTFVVLTTRGVNVDVAGLPSLLDSQAAYIGVIGSKRRWATTKKELVASGVSEEELESVFSPMGLEINAETPEEIAVSIMAEIILQQRGGHGRSMSK